MKTETILILERGDLIEINQNKDIDLIMAADFKPGFLEPMQISPIVIFKDNSGDIKTLKDRYNCKENRAQIVARRILENSTFGALGKPSYGSMVDPEAKYPVTYTIKQDGTKVIENTFLLGKDMTENQIKELFDNGTLERIKFLKDSVKLTQTGYAGLDKNGKKVDRREFPDALPLPYNPALNIPYPKSVGKIRQIIMLETNERTKIVLNHRTKKLDEFMGFSDDFDRSKYIPNHEKSFMEFQNLYSISNGDIENNDWILDTRNGKIAQNVNNVIKEFNPAIRKIELSTNKEVTPDGIMSWASVQKFINEYNAEDGK